MFSTSRSNLLAAAEPASIVRPLSNRTLRCDGMLGERAERGWMDWMWRREAVSDEDAW